MPDEVTDSSAPGRDEEQDERLKRLEEASGNKVGFDSIVKWAKGIMTILGVVAVVVGYGVQYGKFTSAIEANTKAITKLQEGQEKVNENISKLKDAVQERLRQGDSAVGEIRGSLLALRTEVRVRHEDATFTSTLPSMLPPGFDPSGPPPGTSPKTRPLKRPPPQKVQEEMAAEAADMAIEKAVNAAPNPREDPLEQLAF